MKRLGSIALALASLVVAQPASGDPLSVTADGPEVVSPAAARRADAETYAAMFGVSEQAALSRLDTQDDAGILAERVARLLGDDYVYWGVDHERGFELFFGVRSLSAARAHIPTSVNGFPVELREAPFGKASLDRFTEAVWRSANIDGQFDSTTDLQTGVVTYFVTDTTAASTLEGAIAAVRSSSEFAGIPVPVIEYVEALSEPDYLEGGRALASPICTTGFPIWTNGPSGSMHRAVTTAGHCGSTASYGGCSLPVWYISASGNYDRDALGSGSCNSMPASFYTGIDHRIPNGTISMGLNSMFCKYGRTTGRTCGTVVLATYDPSYLSGSGNDFRVLEAANCVDMGQGGDSGGPYYLNNSAAGTHSGGYEHICSRRAIASPSGRVFDANNFRLRTY